MVLPNGQVVTSSLGHLGLGGLGHVGLGVGVVKQPIIAKVATDDYDPNPQYSYSYDVNVNIIFTIYNRDLSKNISKT